MTGSERRCGLALSVQRALQIVICAVLALLAAGCDGSPHNSTAGPTPSVTVATTTAISPYPSSPTATPTVTTTSTPTSVVTPGDNTSGLDQVSLSRVSVPGSVPPANPESGSTTPAALNRGDAIEYRLPGVATAEVDTVLVLVPGFLGGAGTFDYMARRVALRTEGRTAVWAVDRRSNALEDQTGLDAAEAARDPDVAKNYYFNGAAIAGRTFAGFLTETGDDTSYASEWGIKTQIEDLDALIAEAQHRYPNAALFLGGHSLGASIVATYAAWDFNGRAGFEGLCGLLLFEGTPDPAALGVVPDQSAYETRGLPGGLSPVSLASLRSGDPFVSLPFVGSDLFVASEIIAMRASRLFGVPHAISPDADLIDGFFALLFGLDPLPATTNLATLGLGFDYSFQPLAFARVSLGEPIGPVGPNPRAGLFAAFGADPAELRAPTDPTATYDWLPSPALTPPTATDPEIFARVLFEGPSNFIEWYFPGRLTLDASITSSLNVGQSGDWRKDVYGLAVTENARVDVPVFAVAGGRGLVREAARFDGYRESLSPVLRGGSVRSAVAEGFEAFSRPGFAHVDVLTATDTGAGNGVFGPMVDWMHRAIALAPPHR